MWDLIVSVPDHCLSFYFTNFKLWTDNPYSAMQNHFQLNFDPRRLHIYLFFSRRVLY